MIVLSLLLTACFGGLNADHKDTAEPCACNSLIPVPQSGMDDGDPDPADVHQEVFGVSPMPYHLHLGIHQDPASDMSFMWQTDVDTLASTVELQPTASGEIRVVEGASFLDYEGESRFHEVRACDLEPGTAYTYRVGGEGAWSPEYAFHTAPADGEHALRLAILGDSRGGYAVWGALLHCVQAFEPDAIIFTGDMVSSGYDMEEWNQWLEAGEGVLESIPLLAVHGNHEMLAQSYFAIFSLPGNEQWYSMPWGPAQLVVLNDTVNDQEDLGKQAKWLGTELDETDRPWPVIAHHQPTWTASSHGSRADLRALWGTHWERHAPALVFSGHNHLYERTFRMGGEEFDKAGTQYVVSGSAGAPIYSAHEDWFIAVSEAVEHYVVLDLTPERAVMNAYRLDGSLLDSVELER